MTNCSLIGIAVLLLFGTLDVSDTAAVAEDFYVATDGNDAHSGRLPVPNDDKTDGPLATLQRARDEIRKLKAAGPLRTGVTVLVRKGTYYLPNTFRLEPTDSGTAEVPVVYRAFKDEAVTLSGGRPITGFVSHKGAILKADLESQGFPEFHFRQLFFNGKRQHLARYPNFDSEAPICGGWAFVPGARIAMYGKPLSETIEQRRTLHVRPEDVHDWARPEEGEVVLLPYHTWWNHIVGIASVDKNNGIVKLKPDNTGFESRLGRRLFGMRPGSRFYFRNLLEELDAPGEWYLDKNTWTLYFWPPTPMKDAVVTAPTMRRLIDITKGTSHVTIHGFTLECCDMEAVCMYQTDHCRVEKCVVSSAMGYRSSLGSIRMSGTNNRAAGNDVHSVGGVGIVLGGGDPETLTPGGNVAENNYVHHTGVFYKAGVGIRCNGVGNRVAHNLIHDTPRGGISWNGSDHVIEYNHLRHTNTEIADTAAINACNCSWTKRGTVIRYNYIHDALGFGMNRDGEWISPYYCWGIYLDNITCGTTLYGNILVRIYRGGPFIHGGRDNRIENNVIIDGTLTQMTYSSWKPLTEPQAQRMRDAFDQYAGLPAYKKYPAIGPLLDMPFEERLKMSGNKFLRNIIYYANPDAMLYRHRNLDFETTESDYNLIYHLGGNLVMTFKEVPPEKQWEEWKKLGFEEHSIIADPLFVDPEKDDYRLTPESPAFKLGFKPIPVEKIGPYESPLRASWPIVEAEGVRERPLDLDVLPRPLLHE